MSLAGKLVVLTEFKSCPDRMFETVAVKPYQLVDASPSRVKSMELLDGSWGALGSIFRVTYNDEGKAVTAKIKVNAIDEANKSVTYEAVEGEIIQLYATFKSSFQVETGEDGKNIATWTIDFLKLLPDSPDPTSLMNMYEAMVKDIDANN